MGRVVGTVFFFIVVLKGCVVFGIVLVGKCMNDGVSRGIDE